MSHVLPDEKQEKAAALVADGRLTNEDIAKRVGCTRRTLQRWLTNDDFMTRVGDISGQIVSQVVTQSIADRQVRVTALEDAFNRIEQVIAERAADSSMADVPGGKTGIVVRTYKAVGAGPSATMVEEYNIDTVALRERRATLQQVAQELGQWTEKHEHSGELLVREYVGVPLDEV